MVILSNFSVTLSCTIDSSKHHYKSFKAQLYYNSREHNYTVVMVSNYKINIGFKLVERLKATGLPNFTSYELNDITGIVFR